jgi:hypothetical protein
MLRPLRSAIILFSLLTIPLRANLGETVKQCVVRYGAPVGFSEASAKIPFGTLVFSATGYTLVVFLIDGKEVGARVSKQDKSPFTEAEMQNIMDADLAGSAWTPTSSDDPTCLRWIRGDKATVLYDKDKHILIFTSQAMANAVHAAPANPGGPATNSPANGGKTSP